MAWNRRKQDAKDAAAAAADLADYNKRIEQDQCAHHDCTPTEWYWSGQIQTMSCNTCGLAEWRDEKDS